MEVKTYSIKRDLSQPITNIVRHDNKSLINVSIAQDNSEEGFIILTANVYEKDIEVVLDESVYAYQWHKHNHLAETDMNYATGKTICVPLKDADETKGTGHKFTVDIVEI